VLKSFRIITSNITSAITVAINDLIGMAPSKGTDQLLLPFLKYKVNSLYEKYNELFKGKDYVERALIA
jgi:hypothetical protein